MRGPSRHGVSFHIARAEDAGPLVRFRNAYYGTDLRVSEWRWAHMTWLPERAVFVYAKKDGAVIATQAMIPVPLHIRGERVLTGKSEATLILLPYRGTGVMAELYAFAMDLCRQAGMDVLWGFTDAVRAFESFGFRVSPDVAVMTRAGNPARALMAILRSGRPASRKAAAMLRFLFRKALCMSRSPVRDPGTGTGLSLQRNPGARDVASFYGRVRGQDLGLVTLTYDAAYMDWRVRNHPGNPYAEYGVYRDGIMTGYAILGRFRERASVTNLTSLDGGSTSLLLDRIIRDTGREAGEIAFLRNRRDPLGRYGAASLRRFGFRDAWRWNMVIQDLRGGDAAPLPDLNAWHITGLWTEGCSI